MPAAVIEWGCLFSKDARRARNAIERCHQAAKVLQRYFFPIVQRVRRQKVERLVGHCILGVLVAALTLLCRS